MQNEPQRVFLLTNDDGVDEPGLEALGAALEGLGRYVVIAPSGPRSGCSHAVTTGRRITYRRVGPNCVAVDGTPADCIRLGFYRMASDCEWVLAGINPGGNLGADIHHSGTVAAVREAVLHGRPGIAVSHYIAHGRMIDWVRAQHWSRMTIEFVLGLPWEPGTFWNVNLPHPGPGARDPQILLCPVDPSPLPLDFDIEEETVGALYIGDYHRRARIPGSDVDVCFGGDIAVSRIRLLGP